MEPKRKESRIAVRVPKELKTRLEAAEKSTGIPEAILVTRCVEALLDYIESHKEITMPLVVKPKSEEEHVAPLVPRKKNAA